MTPRAKAQLDAFAEALSETGHVVTAGQRIGVGLTRARELFRRLCDDLGPQAEAKPVQNGRR